MRNVFAAGMAGLFSFSMGCSGSSLTAVGVTEIAPVIEDETPAPPAVEPVDETSEQPPEDSPVVPPPADDPPADDPVDNTSTTTTPPPPAPVVCGPNSFESNGACECDTLYAMCDASDESIGCCAYGIDTFEVTLVRAQIMPYKDAADQTPWDWSGFVPSWLQDVIAAVVSYASEDAADYVDLLDFVYEFAPDLLSGTTPPDPFIAVDITGDEVYATNEDGDTLEPFWNEMVTVTLSASDDMTLRFRDADPTFDDAIHSGIPFTRADLQWLAGLGEISIQGSEGVSSFNVVIEPTP